MFGFQHKTKSCFMVLTSSSQLFSHGTSAGSRPYPDSSFALTTVIIVDTEAYLAHYFAKYASRRIAPEVSIYAFTEETFHTDFNANSSKSSFPGTPRRFHPLRAYLQELHPPAIFSPAALLAIRTLFSLFNITAAMTSFISVMPLSWFEKCCKKYAA